MHNDCNMERAKTILRNNGFKLTAQRQALIEIIDKNVGRHLSTEEIYEKVKVIYPDIGLATVYRAMLLFENLGILYKSNFDDGKYRYELNHQDDDHHHHHLICMNCNNVLEVEEDLLDALEENLEKNYHFKVVNHKVKIFGICKDCQ